VKPHNFLSVKMGLVFCGCPHSVWGLLLLIASIQVFISLIILPVTVQIFEASVDVRTALYTNENKAAAVDAGMTYQFSAGAGGLTSTSGAIYTTTIDPLTNASTTSSYIPASGYSAQLAYEQATRNTWETLMYNSRNLNAPASFYAPTTLFVPMYVPTNYPANTVYSIYLSVSGTNFLQDATGGKNLIVPTAVTSKQVRSGIDITANPTFGNAGINENAAKMFTACVTSAMIRVELFGAFFGFQSIMSVIYFAYVAKCYKNDSAPTAGSSIAILGMIGMFCAYSCAYSNTNLIGIKNIIEDIFLTGSGIGMFLANPLIAILNLMWPLSIVYSLYATKHND
jgi:hypothetical protein